MASLRASARIAEAQAAAEAAAAASFTGLSDALPDGVIPWDPEESDLINVSLSVPPGREFGNLPMRPDHAVRPLWVCPNRHIFLETWSPVYKQAYDFLIAISDPVRRPRFIHEYKITTYSLYAAASLGLKTSDILSGLNRLSKNLLDPKLVQFISETTSKCGKLRLLLKNTRYFIESRDRKILQELLRLPGVSAARIDNRPNYRQLVEAHVTQVQANLSGRRDWVEALNMPPLQQAPQQSQHNSNQAFPWSQQSQHNSQSASSIRIFGQDLEAQSAAQKAAQVAAFRRAIDEMATVTETRDPRTGFLLTAAPDGEGVVIPGTAASLDAADKPVDQAAAMGLENSNSSQNNPDSSSNEAKSAVAAISRKRKQQQREHKRARKHKQESKKAKKAKKHKAASSSSSSSSSSSRMDVVDADEDFSSSQSEGEDQDDDDDILTEEENLDSDGLDDNNHSDGGDDGDPSDDDDTELSHARRVLAIELQPEQVTRVREAATTAKFPMLEEYDFRRDSSTMDLPIELKRTTQIRSYQEKSLSKMFGNGRARSGLIVLPCGAGKTLVGITATTTIAKSTLVFCTTGMAVEQWRLQFLRWSTLPASHIEMFTAQHKDSKFNMNHAKVVITTYSMFAHSGKRAKDAERIMKILTSHEWGLVLLDEVHVAPADRFRECVRATHSFCKLGLTATLVREDDLIQDLYYLIGPKLYEANWMDLQRAGHLANVQCVEVWCRMPGVFYREYLTQESENRRRLLYTMNPNKLRACEYLINLHEKRGDKIMVFSDCVFTLSRYAETLKRPMIHGKTSNEARIMWLRRLRESSHINTLFISAIGDNSIDLPDVSVIIQISSHFAARRQEAQRLGRILRPKSGSRSRYNAFFYSLVSKDTKEMWYATKRQRYLVDQGYAFKVVADVESNYEVEPSLRPVHMTSEREVQAAFVEVMASHESEGGLEMNPEGVYDLFAAQKNRGGSSSNNGGSDDDDDADDEKWFRKQKKKASGANRYSSAASSGAAVQRRVGAGALSGAGGSVVYAESSGGNGGGSGPGGSSTGGGSQKGHGGKLSALEKKRLREIKRVEQLERARQLGVDPNDL